MASTTEEGFVRFVLPKALIKFLPLICKVIESHLNGTTRKLRLCIGDDNAVAILAFRNMIYRSDMFDSRTARKTAEDALHTLLLDSEVVYIVDDPLMMPEKLPNDILQAVTEKSLANLKDFKLSVLAHYECLGVPVKCNADELRAACAQHHFSTVKDEIPEQASKNIGKIIDVPIERIGSSLQQFGILYRDICTNKTINMKQQLSDNFIRLLSFRNFEMPERMNLQCMKTQLEVELRQANCVRLLKDSVFMPKVPPNILKSLAKTGIAGLDTLSLVIYAHGKKFQGIDLSGGYDSLLYAVRTKIQGASLTSSAGSSGSGTTLQMARKRKAEKCLDEESGDDEEDNTDEEEEDEESDDEGSVEEESD